MTTATESWRDRLGPYSPWLTAPARLAVANGVDHGRVPRGTAGNGKPRRHPALAQSDGEIRGSERRRRGEQRIRPQTRAFAHDRQIVPGRRTRRRPRLEAREALG